MASLADHQSNTYIKLLFLGDAKSGKTGALASLVKAGYNLRILDFDNLLDFLVGRLLRECPDRLDQVEYRPLRDKTIPTEGGIMLVGRPSAWTTAIQMLIKWKYGEIDLGSPMNWGPDCILVIDSLSRLCDAAYDFHDAIMPKARGGGNYDGRSVYGNAQDDVEKLLGMITSNTFTCNVIVICHGVYMDIPPAGKKIFPQGVGQKLSPKIPQYFPNYVRAINNGGSRHIQLDSDALIDLATTRPELFPKTLPIDDGLATLFSALRSLPSTPQPKKEEPKPEPTETKVTSISLRRKI